MLVEVVVEVFVVEMVVVEDFVVEVVVVEDFVVEVVVVVTKGTKESLTLNQFKITVTPR